MSSNSSKQVGQCFGLNDINQNRRGVRQSSNRDLHVRFADGTVDQSKGAKKRADIA